MATTCPPENRCDASFPGWLSDGHPTVAEGEVTRKVCFHKFGDCCRETRYIQVKNCSSHYVYKLVPARSCDSRYCGAEKSKSENSLFNEFIKSVFIFFLSS